MTPGEVRLRKHRRRPRHRTAVITVIAASALATPCAALARPETPGTGTASSAHPAVPAGTAVRVSVAVAHVVALVNRARHRAGCSPVSLNAKLSKAARDHSTDMADHRNMSHRGSDGSGPGRRIARAGYDWSAYGENVAYGYPTAASVMAAWMASPGHRRNILTCAFREIGVGLARPGSYWTQDFGATARRPGTRGPLLPTGSRGTDAAGRR
ncbi:CAP domain-containing protein [Streptomyces sp. NPDC059215]|uniref:CAP domain-containing protein n=1 Tax=Streptomyces sp. NPDC059215 TaxID=3346772 RepID=UPI003696C6C7